MSWEGTVISLGFGTAITANAIDLAGIEVSFKIRIMYLIVIVFATAVWIIYGSDD